MKLYYTRYFQCQVENTLTIALILRGFCGYPVENQSPAIFLLAFGFSCARFVLVAPDAPRAVSPTDVGLFTAAL